MLVYLSSTAPATADISTSYVLLGLCRNLNLNVSRNAIDKSTKDDGDNSSFIGGRRRWTLSGDAIWDHTEDHGQAILETTIDSASGQIWFLVTSKTSGDEEFIGTGIITQKDLSWPDENVSSVSFSIQGTGALIQSTGDSTT